MGKTKVNAEAIADMKEMRKNGVLVKDIATKYNISISRTFQLLGDYKLNTENKGNCRYCGVEIVGGDMCGSCYGKLKVVRKLIALGQVIRKCAEEERKQRNGSKTIFKTSGDA